MKYLGKKSLSGFLSGFLKVVWYIVLVGSIVTFFGGILFLFVGPFQNAVTAGIASGSLSGFDMQEWQEFQNIHIGLKILMVPYFGVVVWFLLRIIKKAHHLFKNFKDDEIFNRDNVGLISKLGKQLIIFSILTFNLTSLIVGILLLILCEIFKNGTALQEEHNLTV